MANHAIVVGIDKYWKPDFELKSCVQDAVSFARWLMDSKICQVLPLNLYLLTRVDPSLPDPSVSLPAGVTRMDARFSDLVTATWLMTQRSKGTGEKFFFYFSGHGLTNDSAIDAEDAMVMADFDHTFTDNAVEIRSFIEYFKGTRFKEQFFIIDACRNVLDWGKDFRTRAFTSVADDIDEKLGAVQQFSLLATSPRTRAAAMDTASPFTQELLDGLSGKGTAITLEPHSGEYVVSTSRLFRYVETRMAARKINVSKDENEPVFQVPRINGEHGSNDPEWVRLTAADVAKTTLNVFVDPNNAWKHAQVWIVDQFGDEKGRVNPIQSSPEKLQLEPMLYTARVLAPGYKADRPKYPFELYEEKDLTITLTDDHNARGAKGGSEAIPLALSEPEVGSEARSRLTVRTSDNLARLEIADSQGNVMFKGEGSITAELPPAFYRARLVTPEGQLVEMIVDLAPGTEEQVTLGGPPPAPSPVLKSILQTAEFTRLEDDALIAAKEIGPLSSALLSTILALTGGAVNYDEKWGQRLRSLGFDSFRTAATGWSNGLHILGGSESIGGGEDSDRLAGTRLHLWPIDEEQPELESGTLNPSHVRGLYDFSEGMEPGQYFLSIALPEQRPVVFSVTILPQRVTMLVFHWDASQQWRLFQYSLALSDEEKKLSPDQLRRLDLAQRFYLSGRLDYAFDTARELLRAKWVDPLAGCLGCYLLLRLGRADQLEVPTNNLIVQYAQLSDSHLLKAEYEKNLGNEGAAEESFRRALDTGLPVFADGLTRLSQAIKRYELYSHTRAELVGEMAVKRLRGFLWTAWTPSKKQRPAQPSEVTPVIYNTGEINTAGRDFFRATGDQMFAGRDVIKTETFIQHNRSGGQEDELERIFRDLEQQRLTLPQENHDLLNFLIKEIQASVRKIQAGDDTQQNRTFLLSRLLTVQQIAPDLASVAIEKLSTIGGNLNRVMTDIALKVSRNKK